MSPLGCAAPAPGMLAGEAAGCGAAGGGRHQIRVRRVATSSNNDTSTPSHMAFAPAGRDGRGRIAAPRRPAGVPHPWRAGAGSGPRLPAALTCLAASRSHQSPLSLAVACIRVHCILYTHRLLYKDRLLYKRWQQLAQLRGCASQPRAAARRASQLQLGNRFQVHNVWAVRQAQRARTSPHVRQRSHV